MSSAVVVSYPPSRRQPARGGVSRTALGILGALVALVAALLVCVTPAQAATDYTKYLVGDTVSPTGTTINLFDYWVAGATNDNSANINRYGANDDTGINAGHSLKFNGGESATSINKWTGSATPRNFVSKTLANGYPQISSGSESLAYLFDTSSQTGKASYYNVMGLLRSQDGYFYYDSTQNFASYDKQTNSFDVYNKWGVKKGGAGGDVNGQFFPFNSAGDVFSVMPWGSLTQQDINCDANSTLNHHFGLTMETQFTQPEDGHVIYNGQAQDMTYEFAGDDDVWVYIDGVLVGDLGGIHDRATLNINFHTGDVQVNGSSVGSLKSLYGAAGREGATRWDGNTYKANTRHTLKFFYLERGAYASNMKLRFNLSEQPVSEVKKADQNGNPVAGAQFKLFSADKNYNYTENDLLATGTTSDAGTLQLVKSDGSPISFDYEYATNHREHYVLREVTPPVGYRTSLTAGDKELHLDYVRTKDTDPTVTGGALVSPNQGVDSEGYPIKDASGNSITVSRQWISGGYATASETITAKDDLSEIKDRKGNSLGTGLTFAVVLRNGKVGSAKDATEDSNWFAVKGNDLYGYSLCEGHSVAGAVEAAHDAEKNGYSTVFTPSSTGFYGATLSYLPGDISTYAFMMTQEDAAAGKAQYTVAVYHTTASSLGDATMDNTARVESSNFRRKFPARLNLTNVQNRLWVQKVDDAGVPVAGAQFELYEAKDVTVGKDGSYTINEGAQPYDTATTKEETIYYGLKGGVAFPQGSDQHKPLVKGVYYLRESKAPDGYTRNETITKVYVDDSGVYVDAGKTDDGVRSMSGPGSLLSLLSQFGRTTGLDGTLAYVRGTLQSATVDSDGNLEWNRGVSSSEGITSNTQMTDGWMDMKYGGTLVDGKPVLKYVTDNDSGSLPIIYADTGINRMRLVQNGTKTTNGDDLGDLQVNQLFTQASGVEYTDVRVASLEVTKQVTADADLTAPDAAFSFRFELPESDAGYDACVFNANGSVAGTTFKLKNGDVRSITAGQTIHVFGLSAGDHYKVEEVTTQAQASEGDPFATLGTFLTQSGQKSALSNGFSLVRRIQGGHELEGEGNSIEGHLAAASGDQTPEANKLVFVNRYSVTSTTLPASEGFWAKKVLSGRDWADDDSFKLRLQAADGAPMPKGAQADGSGAAYVDVPVSKANKDANVSFGDITYSAPGTYAYSIFELSGQQDGMSFSAASYEVKVTVEDQHDGTLKVTDVSMTKKTDDAGVSVPATDAPVAAKTATFTNTYNDYKSSVSFAANKAYTDGTGTNPLAEGMFSFKLEAVGGYDSDTAPFNPGTVDEAISPAMPEGTTGSVFTTTNDATGNVKFHSISLTAAKDAGKTYVYRLTEVNAKRAGYTYDGAEYYVVVRNHWNGNGISTKYLYYKVQSDDSVEALAEKVVPTFSNRYDATLVEADPIAGHKTLTGRGWKTSGETFSFVYSAADTATEEAVRNGSVVLPASTEGQVKGVKGDAATKDIDFGQNGITFEKPGTYTFGVREKNASGQADGLTYDQHASKVTYVVSDLDAEGNHTGKLSVSRVTYNNSSAITEKDRAYTAGVAFTNAYHAQTTFAGVDLTKTMEGKALDEGAYKFQVSGLAYNGSLTSVGQAESLVTNPAADEKQTAHVTVNGGKILSRTLTEQDLGRVYAYRIHEMNDRDGNGYRYDTLNSGDAVVLVEAYLNDSAGSDLSKLNYLVTVLKGQKAIKMLEDAGGDANVFTGEKIGELIEAAKKDSGLYAVQYDSAKPADAAATPTVAFVNEYTSSLDYKAAGGLSLVKTLKDPSGSTPGNPSQDFKFELTPQATDGSTTAQEAADKLGIELDGEAFFTGKMGYGSTEVNLLPNGLKFTQADAGKTFTYTVREVTGADAGFTYDDATYTVAISVADNGDGTMTATTKVSKAAADGSSTDELRTYIYTTGQDKDDANAAKVPITNLYMVSVGDEAKFTPAAVKLVTGKDADETFTFELSCDDATRDAIDRGVITGSNLSSDNHYAITASTSGKIKNGTTQTVGFPTMTFNAVGTYHFKLCEVVEARAASEWRYDTHVHDVDVTVTDQGGKLVASHTDSAGNSNLFTNSFSTSTSYGAAGGLDIVKTLSGRELRAGDFTFVVEAANDDAKAKLGKDSLEVTNGAPDAEGKATASPLDYMTFSTGDLGKSFEFKISEKNDGKAGYTYDDTYYVVTVAPKTADQGTTIYTETSIEKFDAAGKSLGELDPVTGTAENPVIAKVAFTNSYDATGEFSVKASKTLTGSAAQEGRYRFTASIIGSTNLEETSVKDVDVKPGEKTPVDFGTVRLTLSDDVADGSVTTPDGSISLTAMDKKGLAARAESSSGDGTYDYTFGVRVSEDVSSLPDGVRPSAAEPSYVVTVTVQDDGQGNLTSTVSYPTTSNELNFINTQDKVKTIGTADRPTVDIDGQVLSVGDEYIYTINWVNNAADENGNLTAADVTVTDTLPAGLALVEDGTTFGYTWNDDNTLVWKLGQQDANASGSISIRVRVTEDAVVRDGESMGTIKNTATVAVGENRSYTGTTTNYVPKKSVTDAAGNDVNGQAVKVGDSLTYSVTVSNKTASEASYVITDPVDAGLTVTDVSDHGTYDLGSRTITWPEFTLAPGESRTVTFAATVSSAAVTKDAVTNQASVKVGNNPEVKTNVVTVTVPSAGKLAVSKTVEGHAADKSFDFTVALTGTDGKPVSGTFGTGSAAVTFDESGMATFKLKGGESKTISGLPEGVAYKVTEAPAAGYTATSEGAEGTVTADGATAAFTNTYGITKTTTVSTDALFGKKLVGRGWKDGDSFTFSIAADAASAANTPMPADTTATVASATAKDGDIVRFGFGSIEFSAPGTYVYDVSETGDDANGITLDRNVAKLTIHVTDNGDGTLSVSKGSVVVESGIFTNTYTSELNYNATAGLWLTKTLNGRAMTDGQFTFVLVAQDKASADRLGIDLNQGQTLSAPAAAAGKASAEVDVLAGHSLTFAQTDAGKTYSYRLTEVTPSAAAPGYSYDADSRYITIRVTDSGDGTITAKTTVTGGGQDQSSECTSGQQGTSRLVIPFVNSYQAKGELGGEGSAKIEAIKELSGRELEADEFKFEVIETVDGEEKVVSRGTNDAEGNITFDAISYTQDEVGTHQYVVREVTDGLPAGVTGVATEFPITVTVTDKGDGTLSTSVGYPKDTSSLTFKNAYGSGSMVEVPMAGSKAYETPQGEGYNAPSIDGKFEFTLTGKDGAPMPAGSVGGTKVVKNVNGSVDFGSINYQMPDVDGAPGRSKTFTYTVAETGGEVEGVTRDTAEKTIKVTVRDNGGGTLSATVADGDGQPTEQGALKFAFTNTYTPSSVESSVTDEGGISVTKELTGRKLMAGEFTFRLIDQATGEDAVAAAKNDAQGKVAFDPITYTEPGTHYYTLAEEQGSAGGVTFDHTQRTVRVTVRDNGAGSLVATTELLDADGGVAGSKDVTFSNSYVPSNGSARVVAAKVLDGASLTEGQFAFELTDADGNVLQTARNAADGSVAFDELTYGAADAGKTYVYHVREVNDGQANVTYDSTVRSFSVAVADDGQGHIVATVSGVDDLTFTNAYNEPSTPDQPDKPDQPGTPSDTPEGPGGEQAPELPNTGDQSASLPLLGGLAGVGVVALLAALVVRRRRS